MFEQRKSLVFLALQQRLSTNPDSFKTLIAFVKEVWINLFSYVTFEITIKTCQVAERIITMKKMKQVVMRLFSTLVSWLGMSRAEMGPDGVGKILKNFCESVNKARDSVVQLRKAYPKQIHQNQQILPTQQKARGTESSTGSGALPLGFFSELSEKISKATPYKSEEEAEEDVAKEEITKNPQERTRLENKVNCDNDTEAKVNMRGKGEEQGGRGRNR